MRAEPGEVPGIVPSIYLHRLDSVEWIAWNGTVEWNSGMEYWNATPSWVGFTHAYIDHASFSDSWRREWRCSRQLTSVCNCSCTRLQAMAVRGSGTVESPFTLVSDSPPRKCAGQQRGQTHGYDSPVKVLEGGKFR